MPTDWYTQAAERYSESLTIWLQNTRLQSEAVSRLYRDYQNTGKIDFAEQSWPKPAKGDLPLKSFKIHPIPLAQRMEDLLKVAWRTQFCFLESLWEEYLHDLMLELRHKDASIFEPFCEREYMASLVKDVLVGELASIDEIKTEAATRFSTGITRQGWRDQWKQLRRLEIGLNDDAEKEAWFAGLDTYFEMRNCIIHRNCSVSTLLRQKTEWYDKNKKDVIEVWPNHLDFYRGQFLDCLRYIEAKIRGRYESK